ncbi:MAG TPA: hypothetical protein VHG89_04890 [Verrucomicrobiae bacterium]|nr:hypothetical protein [Verrucomicrobiae bacterium]
MSDTSSSLTIKVGVAGVSAALAGIKSLSEGVKGLLGFVSAEFDPRALTDTVKNVLELGRTFSDLHAQSNISIQSLVAIDEALKRVGGSASGVSTQIALMQRTIADAASGKNTNAEKALNVLNLDPQNLVNLHADQQLLQIGTALNQVANDSQRAEIAMQLFGRSGATMLQVFRDPVAMELLQGGGGNFGAVMARNAAAWKDFLFNLDQTFNAVKTKFVAGFLDLLPVQAMSDKLREVWENMDFTGFGQRAGALVSVVIDAFRNGQLPEMLGLLVEAGFELGEIAVQKTWLALWHGLTGATAGEIYLGLINAIMTFGVKAEEFLVKILSYPVAFFAASWLWLGDQIKSVFTDAINFFVSKWNSAIQHLPGGGKLTLTPVASPAPSSFSQDWKDASDYLAATVGNANDWLNKQLDATRNILGINQKLSASDNTRADALTRLNALIDEQLKKVNAVKVAESPSANGSPVQGVSVRDELAAQEVVMKKELLDLNEKLAQVEGDYTKSAVEKYTEKQKLLEQERDLLTDIIARNNQLIQAPGTDDHDKQLLLQRNNSYESQLNGVNGQLGKMGADPTSFTAQFQTTLTGLQDQWGTWATQMSGLFKSVFNDAISSVSKNITGLIMGTETWSQALANIGTSVLQTVIQAIVEMGVRWIGTQLLMAAVGRSILTATLATTTPIAAAQSAVWSAPAALATIASYGGAAAIAPEYIALALGLSLAESLASFASGGFTGAGGKYDVAGLVHRGEFVMPAEAVNRIGVPQLEAMKSGASTGAATTVEGHKVNLHFYDSRPHPRDFLASSEGENMVVNIARKNRIKIGIGT